MFSLILDTSTEKPLVVFAKGIDCFLKILLPQGDRSSHTLLPAIENGLRDLSIKMTDIKAIGVGVGPGSYTGIRVGVSAAKGLSLPRSIPLVPFCSLAGFISEENGIFLSLIKTRTGGGYILPQENREGRAYPLKPPAFVSNEELSGYLNEYSNVTGPHLDYPNPSHLAFLVENKFRMGEFSSDVKLLYLRSPDYQREGSEKSMFTSGCTCLGD